MHYTYMRVSGALAFSAVCAVGLATGLGLASGGARADPVDHGRPFLALDEVRLGVLAANLEEGGSEEAEVLINGELLFGRPEHAYSDHILDYFLRPRPHIGFSITPDEGTNQVYAGLTWDLELTGGLFVEASFGGVLHDGPTDSNDPNSYGCSLMFRESASLGYNINEHVRVMLTVDHISNAGLCDQNQGLTNAGVRLGYRW
jgi:lipid A 3-O-deacylase